MAKSPYVHDRLDDDDDVLRDGARRSVPMMLRDGTTVELENWQREVIWANRFGLDDAAALHRNGPRYNTDADARRRVEEARAEGIRDMCDAWKRKPAANSETGVGSHEFRGQQPGDKCTINGAPGHLNQRLECVPDQRQDAVPRTMTADAAQKIKDAAWLEMCRDLEGEWKKPLP
jgi:hypothetical protein